MSAQRTAYVLHAVPIERAKPVARPPVDSTKCPHFEGGRLGIILSSKATGRRFFTPPLGVRLTVSQTEDIVRAWRECGQGSDIYEIAAARVVGDFVLWLGRVSEAG